VYLTLCPGVRHGEIEIVPFLDWCANIKVGISPALVADLRDNERHDVLVRFVATSLQKLCDRDGLDFSKIRQAENLLLERGTELESIHLLKETVSYRVVISFQLYPKGGASVAFIEYTDKKVNKSARKVWTELILYDDLYWLACSVIVKNGVVHIRPRTTHKARFCRKFYKVSHKLRVSDLFKPSPAEL